MQFQSFWKTSSHFWARAYILTQAKLALSSAATGAGHSAVHHWCDGVLTGLFFEDQKVTIWWCKVRTVRLMQQSYPSKICYGLCGDTSIVMEEQHFRYFSCGINSTNVRIQLLIVSIQWLESLASQARSSQEHNFLIPEDSDHDFSSLQRALEFCLPWGCCMVPFHNCHLDSGSECFHSLWQSATGSPHFQLLY